MMIHAQKESQGHLGSVVNGTASGCLAGHWSSLVDVASRRVPRLLRYLVQDPRSRFDPKAWLIMFQNYAAKSVFSSMPACSV